LGAPLGGTTRDGQKGLESLTLRLITPPNLVEGGGNCSPLMVIVELGEPGTPLIFWARTGTHQKPEIRTINRDRVPAIIGWKGFGRSRFIEEKNLRIIFEFCFH
jgi:hypothetical protein